eukprot:scaffold2447_cov110-Cylindrotheca_fusiformis.AAC.6
MKNTFGCSIAQWQSLQHLGPAISDLLPNLVIEDLVALKINGCTATHRQIEIIARFNRPRLIRTAYLRAVEGPESSSSSPRTECCRLPRLARLSGGNSVPSTQVRWHPLALTLFFLPI